MIGKNFSNGWKKRPDFSNDWKKFSAHLLETNRTKRRQTTRRTKPSDNSDNSRQLFWRQLGQPGTTLSRCRADNSARLEGANGKRKMRKRQEGTREAECPSMSRPLIALSLALREYDLPAPAEIRPFAPQRAHRLQTREMVLHPGLRDVPQLFRDAPAGRCRIPGKVVQDVPLDFRNVPSRLGSCLGSSGACLGSCLGSSPVCLINGTIGMSNGNCPSAPRAPKRTNEDVRLGTCAFQIPKSPCFPETRGKPSNRLNRRRVGGRVETAS